MVLLTTSLLMAAALAGGCESAQPLAGQQLQAQEGAPRDTGLLAGADTYLRQGNPNQNQGAESGLKLQASGKDRALLWWDPPAIRGAVGGDSLAGARLQLTIALNADNWGSSGRTIDLHRLTQVWTELGATWNCATDTDPGNPVADCSGETAWDMDGPNPRPWVPTPTATVVITNGLTGVVTLDVTADVADLLTGNGVLHGWVLKKTDEGAGGRVDFSSRESASPPRLVLTTVPRVPQDTSRPPIPSGFNLPSPVLTVAYPQDSLAIYFRNVAVVRFDDTTSATTIRRLLTRYQAMIIGGYPRFREYVLQIPDPGPSFAALDSVVTALRNEPGVARARWADYQARFDIQGRFPNDGAGMNRAAWFDGTGTDGIRPRLKVRAPLAWGCETGTYDAQRVTIGSIDVLYGYSDLDGSIVRRLPPPEWDDAGNRLFQPALRNDTPVVRNHGTQMLGVLAATGDNGSGVAGMIWGAHLLLFPQGNIRGDFLYLTTEGPARFRDALATAADSGVGIVVTAYQVGNRGDTLALGTAREGIQAYLSADPRNLLVMALYNDSNRVPLSVIQASTNIHATARAVAQLYDPFRDQILLVAGADTSGGRLTHFSDFWIGATQIVAPAEDILTLDYPTGVVSRSGVSFAAAFVAGVAAQLRAMDPTLTAAQVKDYILRGAREPKGWSAPGVRIPATPVAGAPETVYQLDAYGALTLLARERPGTPICGFPVDVDPESFRAVVLHRSQPQTLPFSLPEDAWVQSVWVAQGGRRLAIQRQDFDGVNTVTTVLETDHHGTVLHTLTGVDRRWYLETDTADASPWDGPVTVTFRGAGGVDSIPVSARVGIPAGWRVYWGFVSPSPDGAWVAAFHWLLSDAGPASEVARWDLVPRDPASPVVPVYADTIDWDACARAGEFCNEVTWAPMAEWSAGGQRVWLPVGQQRAGPGSFEGRTLVFTVPVVSGVPTPPAGPVILDGTWAFSANVPATDSVVRTNEMTDFLNGGCVSQLRWATAPASAWGTTPDDPACIEQGRLFNAPRRVARWP